MPSTMSTSRRRRLAVVVEGEQHDVDDAVGRLDLGALVALEDVLDDERVQAEGLADRFDLGRRRRRQVDPDARLGLAPAGLGSAGEGLVALGFLERAVDIRRDAGSVPAPRSTSGGGGRATGSPRPGVLGISGGVRLGRRSSPASIRVPGGCAVAVGRVGAARAAASDERRAGRRRRSRPRPRGTARP